MIDQLRQNRDSHNCSFHIANTVIGDAPLTVDLSPGIAYSLRTHGGPATGRYSKIVNNSKVAWLESRVGWSVDTVIFDCEGYMGPVLSGSHASMLRSDSSVQMILIEQDGTADYNGTWSQQLVGAGFERIWRIRDTTPWGSPDGYSAWRRGGLGGLPTCRQYARQHGLDQTKLHCLDSRYP